MFSANADSIKTWNLNSHGRMTKMPIETERPTGGIRFKIKNKIAIVTAPRHMFWRSTPLNPISDAMQNTRYNQIAKSHPQVPSMSNAEKTPPMALAIHPKNHLQQNTSY